MSNKREGLLYISKSINMYSTLNHFMYSTLNDFWNRVCARGACWPVPLSLVTCEFIESLAMSASERHSDSHFLLGLSARARGRDSGKGACERVYKRSVGWVPIDAGYSSVKIYSFMFSGSKDLYNEHLGASSAQPRSKLGRQVGAAIEMETIAGRLRTSGHVYMDDMFALCPVRPYPCVCECACLCSCV